MKKKELKLKDFTKDGLYHATFDIPKANYCKTYYDAGYIVEYALIYIANKRIFSSPKRLPEEVIENILKILRKHNVIEFKVNLPPTNTTN